MTTVQQQVEWKSVASHWWKKYLKERHDRLNAQQRQEAIEDMFEEYKNHYNAMVKKRTEESKKLATQEIFADYAAHSRIEDVYKGHKTPFPIRVTMWTAVTIIVLVGIWQYGSNADFRAGLSNSSGFIVLLLALAVIFYYLYTRKKR